MHLQPRVFAYQGWPANVYTSVDQFPARTENARNNACRDLVVPTPKGMSVERINFDPVFWEGVQSKLVCAFIKLSSRSWLFRIVSQADVIRGELRLVTMASIACTGGT